MKLPPPLTPPPPRRDYYEDPWEQLEAAYKQMCYLLQRDEVEQGSHLRIIHDPTRRQIESEATL